MTKKVRGRNSTGRISCVARKEPVRIALTYNQMQEIYADIEIAVLTDKTCPYAAGILAVFRRLIPNFDRCKSVDPSLYKIPKRQADAILTQCCKWKTDGAVNGVLTWMDKGPGTYED